MRGFSLRAHRTTLECEEIHGLLKVVPYFWTLTLLYDVPPTLPPPVSTWQIALGTAWTLQVGLPDRYTPS